jgi:hypothetical protein
MATLYHRVGASRSRRLRSQLSASWISHAEMAVVRRSPCSLHSPWPSLVAVAGSSDAFTKAKPVHVLAAAKHASRHSLQLRPRLCSIGSSNELPSAVSLAMASPPSALRRRMASLAQADAWNVRHLVRPKAITACSITLPIMEIWLTRREGAPACTPLALPTSTVVTVSPPTTMVMRVDARVKLSAKSSPSRKGNARAVPAPCTGCSPPHLPSVLVLIHVRLRFHPM